MSIHERFAIWFEHECDCNEKMLAMLESVPLERRNDAAFVRALNLAGHLAACRENWLTRMKGEDKAPADWWPLDVNLESLKPRFEAMQGSWRDYLAGLSDEVLRGDFEFTSKTGQRYRWNIEGQIVQLMGHAPYHRGQISMIVESLGGETVDTDFLIWAYDRDTWYGLSAERRTPIT